MLLCTTRNRTERRTKHCLLSVRSHISIQNFTSQKLTLLPPTLIHVKLNNIGPVSIINYFSFAIENFVRRNFLVQHSIMSFLARKFRLQKHFFMPLLEERQSQNHSLSRATDGFCCASKKVIQVLLGTKYFFLGQNKRSTSRQFSAAD